ncbi:MAG: hypothetical protein HQL95_05170 [Magnetococcales bacterium]|nr:hypothetical protein [Magnetococcales bacterium]
MKNSTCHARSLLAVLVVLISAQTPVKAEDAESSLPVWDPERYGVVGKYTPWTLSGAVGLRISENILKNKEVQVQTLQNQWFSQLLAGKGATGYIMEPYIARWKTDFMTGLTLSRSAESHQSNQSGGSGSQDEERKVNLSAQSLRSNMDLQLFPESNFPFNAYFNRDNTGNTSTNTDSLGQLSQRFGLSQMYRDKEAEMNVRLQAERRLDSSGGKNGSGLLPMVLPSIKNIDDDRTSDMVTLRADKRLDDHNLDMTARLVRQNGRTRLGKGLIWERSLVVSHSVTPMEELSINNMANVTRNRNFKRNFDDEALGIYRETDEFQTNKLEQFTSNAYWRSAESPLMLSATLRAYQENNSNSSSDSFYSKLSPGTQTALGLLGPDGLPINANGTSASTQSSSGSVRTRSVNGRLGAGYRFDQHHNVNAAFAANQDLRELTQETGVTETDLYRLTQSVGYQYDSGVIPLDAYNYFWFSGSNLASSQGSGANATHHLSERLGHGVERAFPWEEQEAVIRLNLEESTGLTRSTFFEQDLTHALGLGYEFNQEGSRSMAEMRVTDSRTLTTPGNETQMFNLQFSRSNASDDAENWGGSLSLNWLRNLDKSGLESTSQTASGNVRYTRVGVFGIPQMRYNMITTLTGDSWALGALGPSEQEISWRNNLSYNIGKINLRVGSELKYLQDKLGDKSYQALLTFEVVRNFYRRFEQ